MKKLNLKEIIKEKGLNKRELALMLFPGNIKPDAALQRIVREGHDLNESQISKLALFAGVEVEDLYAGFWKGKASGNQIKLIRGEYVAILDPKTMTTRLFSNLSLLHEEVLSGKAITLSEYIKYLDKLINTKLK